MAMNYVTFNQDYSRIGVATTAGFRIMYTDPFSKCYETHQGNITRLDMLYSTALVALVLSPRRLVITNTKRNSTICEMTFPSTILAVRMNRKRFVVVTEDQIYVYDISNMKSVHTIDTSPNPQGVCALSPASDRCYLAYPLPQRAVAAPFTPPSHVPPTSPHTTLISGHVMIFDAISKQAVNVIEAHRAPLSCIAMNADGTQLATASDKGTIIRVFSVPDARKLFQFRRGSMPARILSMSFNATSTLLCVSSETETVHVFRLSSAPAGTDSPAAAGRQRRQSEGGLSSASDELNDALGARSAADSDIATRKHDGTLAGMIRRTSQTVGKGFVASMSGYLPSAVSEMLEPARDFAWFKIPKLAGATPGAVRSVVAMSSNSPQVMVVTSDGAFLVFTIDLEKGGEGALVRQYSVLDSGDQPSRVAADET